ncbi:hypothetical protein GCM10027168_00470 [Streptomyces capparidis]
MTPPRAGGAFAPAPLTDEVTAAPGGDAPGGGEAVTGAPARSARTLRARSGPPATPGRGHGAPDTVLPWGSAG